ASPYWAPEAGVRRSPRWLANTPTRWSGLAAPKRPPRSTSNTATRDICPTSPCPPRCAPRASCTGGWRMRCRPIATLPCSWARRSEEAAEINEQHRHARYLPDIALPASLRATSDLDGALAHVLQADRDSLIILGVPVAGMQETCRTLASRLMDASRRHTIHIV